MAAAASARSEADEGLVERPGNPFLWSRVELMFGSECLRLCWWLFEKTEEDGRSLFSEVE